MNGVSPVFNSLNRNKRSAAIDLKDEGQLAALRRFIVARADIVLQNMRPGLVERFGLDAAALRHERPSLIYCNLAAFGSAGPSKMRPGYDPLMQACGGLMSVTGLEGAEPVRVGPSIVDQGAGMWAVTGIITALYRRVLSGEGCEVNTSLYETAIGWMPVQIATYIASGKVPRKNGSENPGIVPYKAFEASDGWLVIAAGNNNLFDRLAATIDHPELPGDPRFCDNPQRVENRKALNALLQDIVATATRAHWLARLTEAGVPCAPVLNVAEVMNDPQFAATCMLQQSVEGQVRLVGIPLQFDGVRPPLRSGPPPLGNATGEILQPEKAKGEDR